MPFESVTMEWPAMQFATTKANSDQHLPLLQKLLGHLLSPYRYLSKLAPALLKKTHQRLIPVAGTSRKFASCRLLVTLGRPLALVTWHNFRLNFLGVPDDTTSIPIEPTCRVRAFFVASRLPMFHLTTMRHARHLRYAWCGLLRSGPYRAPLRAVT